MNLMLPTARRKDGEKQPCIKIWKFDLRIPFVHYEWEIPEMIQACVVFMTGSAATAYLQDLLALLLRWLCPLCLSMSCCTWSTTLWATP